MTASIQTWSPLSCTDRHGLWAAYAENAGMPGVHCQPKWFSALAGGFHHTHYVIDAERAGRIVGLVPLALVKSVFFGRMLVSLPYVNWAGITAEDASVATALIDRAIDLADDLDVRYLELRNHVAHTHAALTDQLTNKVQMRLPLKGSSDDVWKGIRSVVRTQVRKAEKRGLAVEFGGTELLKDFYAVFCSNMRDLGTPVYGKRLFHSILTELRDQSELCVVRLDKRPIASALAVHASNLTEVPSASTLRAYRSTAANSLMYWHLIQRALQRGQTIFDFGRSTVDSGTYVFKKKWGAVPQPVAWQYYVRKGHVDDVRPENKKYRFARRVWRNLPLGLTRIVGPVVVRGIP